MTFKENVRKGSAMYLLSEEGFEIFYREKDIRIR